MIAVGVCGRDIVPGVALAHCPADSPAAASCPRLGFGSRRPFPLRPAPGTGDQRPPPSPRRPAVTSESPSHANFEVGRYRVLTSPWKVPSKGPNRCLFLENASSPAPTHPAKPPLGSLLTGTAGLCLGKASGRATT